MSTLVGQTVLIQYTKKDGTTNLYELVVTSADLTHIKGELTSINPSGGSGFRTFLVSGINLIRVVANDEAALAADAHVVSDIIRAAHATMIEGEHSFVFFRVVERPGVYDALRRVGLKVHVITGGIVVSW